MKRKLMAATLAVSMAASMAVPAVSFAEEVTTEAAVEATAETPAVKRAILDTDMSYLNDDAIVMFMLAQADSLGECDFLGVTTVGGNTFCAPGTTAALRQLELIGRSDIPVYMGTDIPLMGFRNMEAESQIWGMPEYSGAYWDWNEKTFGDVTKRPTDYKNLPSEPKYGYAETEAQDEHAIDFIIEQVHKYPGEVTIFVIGAGTNMALAVRKDPTIVEDAAGVVYMGGAVDVPGNCNTTAEFNWYYDPEGIRICLNAEWKNQLVVPNDIAEAVFYTKDVYDRIVEKQGNEISKLIVEGQAQRFEENPEASSFVWDSITAAVWLHPEIATDIQERYLTVDTNYGPGYGNAISWWTSRNRDVETGEGMPYGVQKCDILFDIDREAFWDFYVDILTTNV